MLLSTLLVCLPMMFMRCTDITKPPGYPLCILVRLLLYGDILGLSLLLFVLHHCFGVTAARTMWSLYTKLAVQQAVPLRAELKAAGWIILLWSLPTSAGKTWKGCWDCRTTSIYIVCLPPFISAQYVMCVLPNVWYLKPTCAPYVYIPGG